MTVVAISGASWLIVSTSTLDMRQRRINPVLRQFTPSLRFRPLRLASGFFTGDAQNLLARIEFTRAHGSMGARDAVCDIDSGMWFQIGVGAVTGGLVSPLISWGKYDPFTAPAQVEEIRIGCVVHRKM
ncbi:uncharacterized protein EV422DRAFT_570441 [Fimicolochytrium jonesii]|uniref:uncharacterized protein n=1 Tax=Fimicolochytrium jonesii TaxID=1396493 RepID=UPI0022FE4081|nr:uncharacterized protein EV422DRAFT_570441 [Fimicolochytrium jonesii]KAI8817673.1 hypothetical protein EV422DRAFT_570441 [Fimicolochytrium jonesii]